MTDDDLDKEIQRLIRIAKEELTTEQEDRLVKGLLQELGKSFPEKVDLSDRCGPVMDQGPLGSSVACAMASMVECQEKNSSDSRFIYWRSRLLKCDED